MKMIHTEIQMYYKSVSLYSYRYDVLQHMHYRQKERKLTQMNLHITSERIELLLQLL